jgi:drug/metabolite transporter (DMT)-like permease
MGELIVSLAGTPAGEALALALALLSALSHAIFGAVHKGGRDPYLNRGAINVAYSLAAAPFALAILPPPGPELRWALVGMFFIHLVYEWLQARSYAIGGFTVVYPIARGTGPLVIAVTAWGVFGETLSGAQWLGLALLSGGIYGLALANLRAIGMADLAAVARLRAAILTALATGLLIAAYTVWDAWAIRLAENPFTFLAWFFFLGGFGTPVIAALRWRRLGPEGRPPFSDLAARGALGAVIALFSFGAMFLATRLDKVGEVAAIRETSIVFATAIGVLVFRERIDLRRLGLIGVIAAGAVIIELG